MRAPLRRLRGLAGRHGREISGRKSQTGKLLSLSLIAFHTHTHAHTHAHTRSITRTHTLSHTRIYPSLLIRPTDRPRSLLLPFLLSPPFDTSDPQSSHSPPGSSARPQPSLTLPTLASWLAEHATSVRPSVRHARSNSIPSPLLHTDARACLNPSSRLSRAEPRSSGNTPSVSQFPPWAA